MMKLDSKEYFDLLKEQAGLGKEVSMIITGNSMVPFLIHGRDVIYFSKPNRALKKGDMAFFQRNSRQYVMHRICRIRPEGFYFIGDNQTEVEGPIPENRIFGLVTRVKRKGRLIGPRSFWWFFFAHIWIHMIPLRLLLIGMFRRIHSFFHKA